MIKNKYNILTVLGIFVSVVTCAALFFSYRAYVVSNRLETNFKHSIEVLEQEVTSLKAQLAAANNRTEDHSTQRYTPANQAGTAGRKKNTIVKDREAIKRLENIVESTGLEQLAANQNMDPAILSELYDEYADRQQVVQRRQQQLEKNREFHQVDSDQYGEELASLYERARLRRRGGNNRQESDRAFAELTAKYPEAYATGMAIAERALVSGFRRNTSEVEKYYDMLREKENFSDIVTDRGVEAMPNIEYTLARQYHLQGDNDTALVLIESLEKNYPDSLLFRRRFGSGQRWQPVSQVVSNLRQEVELAR